MKGIFSVISLLFLMASCQNARQASPNEETTETLVEEIVPKESWLAAYYPFDENWGDPDEGEELEAWKTERLKRVEQDYSTNNVLGHANGAGPFGAQWNPENDLLIVGYVQLEPGDKPKDVRMAVGKGYRPQALNIDTRDNGDVYFHVMVPKEVWQEQTIEMDESLLNTVYQDKPEPLKIWEQYKETGDETLIGIPPIVGEVLMIRASVTSEAGKGYGKLGILHGVFGE